MKQLYVVALLVFAGGVGPLALAETEARTVRLPVQAKKVRVHPAVPDVSSGAEIVDFEKAFASVEIPVVDGSVSVEITRRPVIVVAETPNDLEPKDPDAIVEDSPFGFHPAKVRGDRRDRDTDPYRYAKDIGIKWDRCGLYFMWCIVQKSILGTDLHWSPYDAYFRGLPEGMRPLKNITVAHANMINERTFVRPGREPDFDVWEFVQKGSYLPSDEDEYRAFVRAAVERYDGDGTDDMPGLRTPCKHWQIANEPPRGLDHYPELVEITSTAIKEADPEAKVLIGGAIYGWRWKRFKEDYVPILRALKGRHIDVFDLHWFRFAGDYASILQVWPEVRSILDETGFEDIPIWLTEVGTYCNTPRGCPPQSEADQAFETVKRYALLLSLGAKKVFWAWGMMEGFKDIGDNDFFDNTGFVYDGIGPNDPGRGTKKLVYHSLKNLIRLTEGAYWEKTSMLDLGKDVFAVRFVLPDRTVFIVWDGAGDARDYTRIPDDIGERIERLHGLSPRLKQGRRFFSDAVDVLRNLARLGFQSGEIDVEEEAMIAREVARAGLLAEAAEVVIGAVRVLHEVHARQR